MISYETIAINRNAPSGSSEIRLYSNGLEGGSGLTVAQLAIAVSIRSAAAYENQSVLKMNVMTSGAGKLEIAAECMYDLANETGEWADTKAILQNELGITDLPDSVDTYKKRLNVISQIKAKVDALTQTQQENMIDLQTLVNRRDVAFSCSSNIVRALGSSMADNAMNF